MALTTNTSIKRRGDQTIPVEVELPVAAGFHGYTGSMCAIDYATGYVVKVTGTMGIGVIGRLEKEVDNSAGGAGALKAKIKQGIFKYTNSSVHPVTAAMRGGPCYAEDDNVVSHDSVSNTLPFAGLIYDVDSDGIWVEQFLLMSGIVQGAFNYSLVSQTYGHADLVAAAHTQSLSFDAGVQPAGAYIAGVQCTLTTPFTGGGASLCTLSLGSAGDPDAIMDAADVFAAAVDGQASTLPSGIAPNKNVGGVQLTVTFDSDVNVADLTAGALTLNVIVVAP